MNELALFAGAGGGILGGKLLGWRCVCAVEIKEFCRNVLMQRQNDGMLEPFPVWDDVSTFDGSYWRGKVDVITGGFPCQDISCNGKGEGIYTGAKSSLWKEMSRIIGEVRPRFVLVENSPELTGRGLERVLSDLASMGYNAEWGVLGANVTGAPHIRKRIWVMGYAYDSVTYKSVSVEERHTRSSCSSVSPLLWWDKDPGDDFKSGVARMAYGVAKGVDKTEAIGNGQVPAVVRLAFNTLIKGFK